MDEHGDDAIDAREDEDGALGGRGGFLAGLVVGAALGAGIALLFAPRKGAKTRAALEAGARRIGSSAGRRFRELKGDGLDAIDEVRERLRTRRGRD